MVMSAILLVAWMADVKVEYDRFDNQTTVRTGDFDLGLKQPESLTLSLIALFDGKNPKESTPATVAAQAIYTGPKSRLQGKGTRLVLLTGNERLQWSAFDAVEHQLSNDQVMEMIQFNVTIADLQKLSAAKSVEARISDVEFRLSEKQISEIREFASRSAPATQPTK